MRLESVTNTQIGETGDQEAFFVIGFFIYACLPSFVPALFTNGFCWVRLKIIILGFFSPMCREARLFAAGNARALLEGLKYIC